MERDIGLFAAYAAADHDLTKVDPASLAERLETELEERISSGTSRRRVKAEIAFVPATKRLVLSVHYQRPAADGCEITADKRLETRPFERPAGSTWGYLHRARRRVTMTLRAPGSPAAKAIRAAMGTMLWDDPDAVAAEPVESYDLAPFKDPSFCLPVLAKHAAAIGRVVVTEIKVDAASGNTIGVRAPGARGDAHADFHALAEGAKVLIEGSRVAEVTLKFLPPGDARRPLTKVRLLSDRIFFADAHQALIDDHLAHWKVRR